nr:hypothetical protein [Niallia taxi]
MGATKELVLLALPKNYLVDATLERLGTSFLDLYNSKIGDDVREFLAVIFFEELIEPETGRQRNLKELRSLYYRDKFKRTKKNWHSALIKSINKTSKNPKELMAEVKFIREGIEKGFIDLANNYHVTDIKDLIADRLSEVDKWVNDDTKLLSDYKYIKDKTKNQIKNTLKIDSIITVTSLVIEEFGGDFNRIVKEVNDLFSELPLPGKTGRTKFMDFHEDLAVENSVTAEIYEDGNLSIRTLLGKTLIEEKNSIALTPMDYEIFNFILSRRDYEFVEKQKIYVDIGDIVKNMYSSRGVKEYKRIRERLEKLKHLSFDIKADDGKKYIFDLFDHITYLDEAETKAEIKINEFMHQRYIDNQVTKIYSDKIQNFQLELSENIVFILQKERFAKNSLLDDSIDRKKGIAYPLAFFTRRLRLPTRKKDALTKVENSLHELVDNQVTIKSFRRVNDVFHIEFLPITEHEAEDLIDAKHQKVLFLET